MLSFLIPIVYIQVSPGLLTVRSVKTGAVVSEVPELVVAHGPKPKHVAAGAEARRQGGGASQVVNPFAHPRSLVSDFAAGEQLLKAFLNRVCKRSLLAASPRVVLHLLGDPAGGFTEVEIRAFQEMALGAGAFKVAIWQGRALTDRELLSGQFPHDGRVLA